MASLIFVVNNSSLRIREGRADLIYMQRIERLIGRIIKQGKINIVVKRGMRNNRRRNSLNMLKKRKVSF
jgi:hypothetical protein